MVQNLSRREMLLNRGVQGHIYGALQSENYSAESFSTLLGGLENVMRGSHSTIVGGYQNEVSENSNYSTLLGGASNSLLTGADNSTVVGGFENNLEFSDSAAVVSGERNFVQYSDDSVTVGGLENIMAGAPGCVSLGGGLQGLGVAVSGNTMTVTRSSTMLGGYGNFIQGGYQAGIFSAWECEMDALASGTIQFSTISGGSFNEIKSANSGIVGGHENVIGQSGYGWNAIIGGGQNTMNNSQFSAMVGTGGLATGSTMTDADRSVIVGGGSLAITGTNQSGLFAGSNNTIDGTGADTNNSAIVGGWSNEITGSANQGAIIASRLSEITVNSNGFIAASRNGRVIHNRAALVATDASQSVQATTLHTDNLHVFNSYVKFASLPTSSTGLAAGQLWVSGTSPNKYLRMA